MNKTRRKGGELLTLKSENTISFKGEDDVGRNGDGFLVHKTWSSNIVSIVGISSRVAYITI